MTAATLPSGRETSASTLMPTLSLIGAMASLCIGTSFAKSLFPEVGAQGTTAYRIVIGAIILIAFWRPWRFPLTARNAAKIALYGVTLACMICCSTWRCAPCRWAWPSPSNSPAR